MTVGLEWLVRTGHPTLSVPFLLCSTHFYCVQRMKLGIFGPWGNGQGLELLMMFLLVYRRYEPLTSYRYNMESGEGDFTLGVE